MTAVWGTNSSLLCPPPPEHQLLGVVPFKLSSSADPYMLPGQVQTPHGWFNQPIGTGWNSPIPLPCYHQQTIVMKFPSFSSQ